MVQDQGSLEKAVNGDYNFSVGEILAEAWERVSGAKLKLVGGMFIYIVITALVTGFISLFLDAQPYYDAEHVMQGREAKQVIDELQVLFHRHYNILFEEKD